MPKSASREAMMAQPSNWMRGQVGEMLLDLVEGHRADTTGVDPPLRLVDLIGNGHTRHACACLITPVRHGARAQRKLPP
jgi:hypothetical protein